jgi:hypothetical protein
MVEAMLKFLHADKTPAGETNGDQPGNVDDSEADGDPQPL